MSSSPAESVLETVVEETWEDVRFLITLAKRERAAGLDTKELDRAVRAVRRRQGDKALYLALVGEFSSGKTSCVNALLGERLLETSAFANTAAVTALRQGTTRTFSVCFRGDSRELKFGSDELDARLAQYNRRAGDFQDTLRTLTSDEEVATTVARVNLRHPSPLLGDDICVLDTPGFNSTQHEHTAASLDVIADDADAYVVLVSATSPVSLTLKALLDERLRPYLHRTTFLVTHMAHIEPEERAGLLAFVERRLRNDLGIEHPLVAPASLGAALRAQAGDPDATTADHEWLAAFETLRDELVIRLRYERTLAIAERVIVLLREAMQLLEASLRDESAVLEKRAAVLERHPPADLRRFCAKQRRTLDAETARFVTSARAMLAQHVSVGERRALQELKQKLDGALTTAALNSVLAGAPNVVERHLRSTSYAAQPAMRTLSEGVRALSTAFDKSFASQFKGLDALSGKAFQPQADAVPPVEVAGVTGDALAVMRQLESRGKRSAAGGASAGTILGTIIAPGIGTLIGAGIGGLLGRGAGSPSIIERRTAYWAQLEPEVRASFALRRKQYEAALDRHAEKAAAYIEHRVTAYEAGYRRTIDALRTSHTQALRELRERLAQARRERTEVDARIALLQQRAQLLGGD